MPQAPAQTLQKHGEALQAELQCDPHEALHPSTISMLGRSAKNASRQYKRTVKRFGFALSHGGALAFLFVSSSFQGAVNNNLFCSCLSCAV